MKNYLKKRLYNYLEYFCIKKIIQLLKSMFLNRGSSDSTN